MTTDADHPGADGAARGAETDQLDAESFPSLVPDQPSFKVTPLCNEQTANDKTTPKQVKVVVHIVIGLKSIGLFVKIGDELLRPEAYLPYYAEPDHPGVDAVRRHEAAGDEFAPVRLTGHAFDDPRANALAVRLMRAGLAVLNQTFMADDNDPRLRLYPQYPKHREVGWLRALDGKRSKDPWKERFENFVRRYAQARQAGKSPLTAREYPAGVPVPKEAHERNAKLWREFRESQRGKSR